LGTPAEDRQTDTLARPSPVDLIRKHPLFLIAFVGGLTLRAVTVATYTPILLLQSDAYVYLRKAVDLEPAAFRPIGYSFFLRPFIEISELRLVGIVQHLMGLAIAVGIYLLVRSWGGGQFVGTLASLPIFFDSYQLDIEQYILAESLFQALSFAPVFLIVRPRPATPRVVGLAGALLGLSALVRLVGVLAIGPLAVYVFVRNKGYRDLLILLVAFAVPVSLYALWFRSDHGTLGLTNKSGRFLYGRVATWADCEGLEIKDYQEILCDPRPVDKRPPANYYVFSGDSPVLRLDPPPGVSTDDALADYSRSVILQQPGGYLSRVGRDVLHAFAPGRYSGPHDAELELWTFPETFRGAGPHAFLVERYEGSPPPEIDDARFRIEPGGARFLRAYQRWVYTWGPALGLMVLIAAVGLVRGSSSARGVVALLSSLGVILMIFPFMTVQFDYRFILLALPFLPPAAAIAAVTIRERKGRLRPEV
jgi:hypothetical protein